ncbi:uncharacterized protein LODBEIA_P58850 [Lodderomyces beijingensis]|uniref:Homeobox domain-containing protein n=1 Tax=Lodderomyces beijingensis TaxID=1775926 RepID=A0ABP0ZVZ9_9ASCO
MQVTALMNQARSTLPSLTITTHLPPTTAMDSTLNTSTVTATTATTVTRKPPQLPPLVKRISLPPISDILAPLSQQQQQQQHQPLPSVSHLNQSSTPPPAPQAPSYTNSYYTTTTHDRLHTLNKSPLPQSYSSSSSTASSIPSPSSSIIPSYHHQQHHHQHQQQHRQHQPQHQPQHQHHHQTYMQPHMMRSNSYPPPSTSASSTTSQPSSPALEVGGGNANAYSKRKTRNNLPKEITFVLLRWLNDHLNHPYPNSFEKNHLMMTTGLNQQQLSNWFINARRRKIKGLKEQKRMCL